MWDLLLTVHSQPNLHSEVLSLIKPTVFVHYDQANSVIHCSANILLLVVVVSIDC